MTEAIAVQTGVSPRDRHRSAERWVAFGWGLAEATFFFIVPDVLLTRLALHDVRRALVAAGWAVAGALAGATILWFAIESGGATALLHWFERLPGINREMSFTAARALQDTGPGAFFSGAVAGPPYRLLATHATVQGISLPALLGVSVLARSLRFFGTTLLAWAVRRALHWLPPGVVLRLHGLCWFAFYVAYFMLVARR